MEKTSDEDYYAACSCGWRSTETSYVSPMLGQVQDHFDAVRAMRGWRPARSAAQAPDRDEHERDADQRQVRAGEHARELYASIEGQQQRLAQNVERLSNVLAADEELADRRVAALEREAARVAQEQGQTTASVQRAEALKRQLERAKELRKGIVSACAAMAVVAEEVAWIHHDLETRHPSGTAEHRRLAHAASTSARKARESGRPGSRPGWPAERTRPPLQPQA